MAPTLGHGKICYLELPAADVSQSAAFYEKIFGWTIHRRADGSVTFADGVGQVNGVWLPGAPPATDPKILIHIMVDNAEATLRAIVEHGGAVTQPIGTHAPEITARFRDPAGNILGVYQERSAS